MWTRISSVWPWALAVVFVLAAAVAVVGESGHRVDVRGVRISAGGYPGDGDKEALRPFNRDGGTALACVLVLSEGGIIGFDKNRCRVNEFVDNRGRKLMDPVARIGSGIGSSHVISRDDKAVLFEIHGENLPGKKATAIRASGVVTVKTAKKQENAKVYGLVLKSGAEFEAGGVHFSISRVDAPEWADGNLNVTFRLNRHPSKIVSLEFKDDKDKPVRSSLISSGRSKINDRVTYDRTYSLAEEIDKVNVDIVFWSDVKTRKLPFSVKAGLGL
ncbi:MAG: hypothetical protein ACQERN_01735 [Thermodesulfobacteriota bacterium]